MFLMQQINMQELFELLICRGVFVVVGGWGSRH